MPAPVSTPHCPFDRLWQPGHPFRARRSRCRRWTMALLLIFMSAIISSYWYLTDPARIKGMSQSYLSELVGGQVEIGSASLTVFEGLKLSKVSVRVDNSALADTRLFFADAIEIQYDPASLLRGQLEATRIIATGARVNLVEDSVAGKWNYQRLHKASGHPSTGKPSDHSPALLPQLVLRDAVVEYSEMQGRQSVPRGSMDITGRFFPSPDRTQYSFELQSRGANEGVGPVVSGQVTLKTGRVDASLSRLQFGQDVEAMLPREVRDFWQAHKVEGSLDIPQFSYTPPNGRNRARFRLATELKHVKLIVRSEEFNASPNFTPGAATSAQGSDGFDHLIRDARRTMDSLHVFPQRPPIAVDDVSGGFYFDENGIHFDHMTGTVAGATLSVSGKIDGYSPDAPVWIRVESIPGKSIEIPEHPDYLASLPDALNQAFYMLKPHGKGTLWAEFNRAGPQELPQVTGEVNIEDGAFDCVFFPYPVHNASGKVVFAPDPTHTFELVRLQDIRGNGLPGGPNQNAELRLSGWVGAGAPDMGCRIRARSTGITSEPALFAAFPPPVRKAISIFHGPGEERLPYFAGDFDCNVFVPPGPDQRPLVSIDLNFTDGGGKLAAFPYPLENLRGKIIVGDGYLTMDGVKLHHADTTLNVSGKVTWQPDLPPGKDVVAKPDLKLIGRNVPIDIELFKVLPPPARSWLRNSGVSGMLDVDGRITPKAVVTDPADSVDYDLNVAVREAAAHPAQTDFTVSDVGGKLRVHPDRLEIVELHGRRGIAELNGTGSINWSAMRPDVKLNATAQHLSLDTPLSQLLPLAGRQAWATLSPTGTTDAELYLHGTWPASPGDPVASLSVPANTPSALPPASLEDFKVVLRPTDVSVMPEPLPYRLDHCAGTITITPELITIAEIHARHGPASVILSGLGLTTNPNSWDLSLHANDLPADAELRRALPLPMRQVLEELKYKGELSVDLSTFRYRGDQADTKIDLGGVLSTHQGSVDVGVPIDQIGGTLQFNAAVRKGKLSAFRGDLAMDKLMLAERQIKNFKAAVDLPAGSDVLRVSDIRASVAGGDLAGQMDLKFPDSGPASYLLDFKVKNADLREIAQQQEGKGQDIRGQASASLALQGEWADPSTRRGRGDVTVGGKEMYQIPLMLGLLEVTNLSLPTSSPFSEGAARYLVDGNRITFQQVQMRNSSVVMSGNGWLDFGSKQVRMNFTTDNPNLPTLPLIGGLISGAKQELLQIQVRGTVQSPKVSAASMHTFTTTVDEVFSGSGREK